MKSYIERLFENYKGDYRPIEYDWGEPAGKEQEYNIDDLDTKSAE